MIADGFTKVCTYYRSTSGRCFFISKSDVTVDTVQHCKLRSAKLKMTRVGGILLDWLSRRNLEKGGTHKSQDQSPQHEYTQEHPSPDFSKSDSTAPCPTRRDTHLFEAVPDRFSPAASGIGAL